VISTAIPPPAPPIRPERQYDRCAAATGGDRIGEIDAHAIDETIHRYHRAAGELWKFCFSRGGGSHAEFIADVLDGMADSAEIIGEWERGTPPRRRR